METQMETYTIFLVVDDFEVEYVGNQHAEDLATILKNTIISQKNGKARSMLALI